MPQHVFLDITSTVVTATVVGGYTIPPHGVVLVDPKGNATPFNVNAPPPINGSIGVAITDKAMTGGQLFQVQITGVIRVSQQKGDIGPQGIQGIQGPEADEGPVAIIQARRSDITYLTPSFVDIIFDLTDIETDPASLYHDLIGDPDSICTLVDGYLIIQWALLVASDGVAGVEVQLMRNDSDVVPGSFTTVEFSDANEQWVFNSIFIHANPGDCFCVSVRKASGSGTCTISSGCTFGASVISGPSGAQGRMGPQGISGIQGLQGTNPGVQGPQGNQGIQGIQGDGPQGVQGWQGQIGPQGDFGPQGDAGLQGLQGDIGYQGDLGPQGVNGGDGLQGLQGDIGPQGPPNWDVIGASPIGVGVADTLITVNIGGIGYQLLAITLP